MLLLGPLDTVGDSDECLDGCRLKDGGDVGTLVGSCEIDGFVDDITVGRIVTDGEWVGLSEGIEEDVGDPVGTAVGNSEGIVDG